MGGEAVGEKANTACNSQSTVVTMLNGEGA